MCPYLFLISLLCLGRAVLHDYDISLGVFISSPGALLQVSYAKACCLSSVSPSVVRLLLAFHIFDISSRSVHWIELKLNGRHCCNMEIQNC